MSTNTNNLPSVEALQDFANQLFKALPEDAPKEISFDPYEHPRATAFAKSITGEGIVPGVNIPVDDALVQAGAPAPFALSDPFGVITAPPAVTGIGMSSSIANYGNINDISPGTTGGSNYQPLVNSPFF
ncbi:MAG: hypothetical protein QM763_15825 [Agriterribacter sp.]